MLSKARRRTERVQLADATLVCSTLSSVCFLILIEAAPILSLFCVLELGSARWTELSQDGVESALPSERADVARLVGRSARVVVFLHRARPQRAARLESLQKRCEEGA